VVYRTKGVRIGDVGYVTQDGAFETLFNIRASAQDPINRRGVPENFEPVDIGEYDVIHAPHYHQRGGVVTSMSAQRVSFGVDFSATQNPYVKFYHAFVLRPFIGSVRLAPSGADVGSQFNWSASEGAILHLPHGASRLNCFSDLFKSHAITHAYSWYKFANQNHHRGVPNGSLYLITGTDKTSSWMVGAFSDALPGDQVSLQLSTAGIDGGSTSYNYSWATASTPVYRTGCSNNRINTDHNDLDAIDRDNTIFQGDAPDNQNQCVFARGYRIMLNCTVTASGGVHSDAEVLPIKDVSPEDVPAATNYIPFAGVSKSTSVSGWSGGRLESSQRRVVSEDSGQDENLDKHWDFEVMLESIPDHSEVSVQGSQRYHLSMALLRLTLESHVIHQRSSANISYNVSVPNTVSLSNSSSP